MYATKVRKIKAKRHNRLTSAEGDRVGRAGPRGGSNCQVEECGRGEGVGVTERAMIGLGGSNF